ncbi:hypothetical protein ABCR94_08165 [Streptomyces sp. 21So2-11]|uniref:hypothetical protein n=1 Tax=Streptomyces sp. 21So2-11 TaxID=3144408 RepID=UPI003219B2EC
MADQAAVCVAVVGQERRGGVERVGGELVDGGAGVGRLDKLTDARLGRGGD